jgi:nucleotide-binding universal stress UspA family protein
MWIKAAARAIKDFEAELIGEEEVMFKNILLPIDGSRASMRSAHRGIELAKVLGARVTVLAVTTPWTVYFSRELAAVVPDVVIPQMEYDLKREAAAAFFLSNIVTDARSADVRAKSVHRSDPDPYQAIVRTAAHERCDLIVMSSHCDGAVTGMLLGSEAMKVMTHTTIPVLVYRENA